MPQPVVNITVPVFNRLVLTQKTLLALRQSSEAVPFCLTVVDNGSDAALVSRLRELHRDGVIDKLFLLPRNMGISCACNVGWAMTDAPYFLKFDNDMLALDPDWLARIFRLWRHGERLSTLGPAWTEEQLRAEPGAIRTPDGVLGICRSNLPGAVLFVPRAVSDILGRWNEDYGLYGAEDGDYGARMNSAGFPQYYYLSVGLIRNMGAEETPEERDYSLDRQAEHRALFVDEKGGTGLFKLNNYMYRRGIRKLDVPPRYVVADVDEAGKVRLRENADYPAVRRALDMCKRAMDGARASKDPDQIFRDEFIEKLRGIMRECGQAT